MSLFCIRRADDGAFVARDQQGYTRDPLKAAWFGSAAAAAKLRCSTERVVSTDALREELAAEEARA